MNDSLKHWFLENKRFFPWRENCSPYRVWISEVMLQQTVASVVVNYFNRWMERFPTIELLSQSHIDDVLKMWEGLGYYSRARRIHEASLVIVKNFQGALPQTYEELATIPGLGPYTIGAILNFAFHKRAYAIDGNVTRVLARYFAIQDEITKTSTQKNIRDHLEKILPREESWIFSEALIELGATICKKKALCSICPLISSCLSYRDGLQQELPKVKMREKTIHIHRIVGLIEHEGSFLLQKGEKGKVMEDLFEFYYFDVEHVPDDEEAFKLLEKNYGLPLQCITRFDKITHTFTKYKAHLYAFKCVASQKKEGLWMAKDKLTALPFSSGHKKLLQGLT